MQWMLYQYVIMVMSLLNTIGSLETLMWRSGSDVRGWLLATITDFVWVIWVRVAVNRKEKRTYKQDPHMQHSRQTQLNQSRKLFHIHTNLLDKSSELYSFLLMPLFGLCSTFSMADNSQCMLALSSLLRLEIPESSLTSLADDFWTKKKHHVCIKFIRILDKRYRRHVEGKFAYRFVLVRIAWRNFVSADDRRGFLWKKNG